MAEEPVSSSKKTQRTDHFLRPTKRSTPCVGICSTSHGDMVCRGCKRFYNEVRDWHEFSEEQRQMVMSRLLSLKQDCVLSEVKVANAAVLYQRTKDLITEDQPSLALRLYEALTHCKGEYESWGIGLSSSASDSSTPEQVQDKIEGEFYERSDALFRLFFSRQPD